MLQIPEKKFLIFKKDLSNLYSALDNLSARKLAKITGKIISFMPSFGNICHIMTRNLHVLMIIATSFHWESIITLTESALIEIDFWYFNCQYLPSKNLFYQLNCLKKLFTQMRANTHVQVIL